MTLGCQKNLKVTNQSRKKIFFEQPYSFVRIGNWEKQLLKSSEAWNLCVEGGCKEAVEDARKEPICGVALVTEESFILYIKYIINNIINI